MSELVAPWPRTEVWLPSCSMSVRHAPSLMPGAPAAVYLHGLGGSSLTWTDLMEDLRAEVDGWAVDLGGFGHSPPPRNGDMSPAGHAACAIEFIENELQAPVHLFGNSLGGAVALQLAARRPDLVRSLTLISPALPVRRLTKSNVHLPVIAVPGIGERLIAKYFELDAGARVRGTIETCLADPGRLPAQRVNEAIEETRNRDHLTYVGDSFLRSLRGLLRTFVDIGPNRPWKLAERVQCETLVVYGKKDPLVDPLAAHRITRHFRDGHVMVLPESGHAAQMEHPDLVAGAWRRFLGAQTPSTLP
ncbi:MAG: alpha/beta hydrolase [Actinomycetota bacterium]|nr:alpha/beta hydrolase [Actinomycetota bacterium]